MLIMGCLYAARHENSCLLRVADVQVPWAQPTHMLQDAANAFNMRMHADSLQS